jgi:type IV secretion system protein VirB9
MKRLILALALAATPAAAQTPPSTVTADPRLQTVAYDPGQIVRLKVATNFQTTVIFGPGEQVENVAIGDADGWQATLNSQGSALFLKPLRSSGTTNMSVITDVRVYSFELTATYAAGGDTPFTVRFTYPDAPGGAQPQARPGVGRYRMSGARSLRPAAIEDDGVRTSVRWGASQTLPAVFAIDDQGDEVLLTGHIRDDRFVIDAVHRTLLFRLDGETARAQRLRERTPR